MAEIVHIDRMSYGSAAVGRLDSGKTVFVEGAVSGDTVEVELLQEKKSFARGRMVQLLEPSLVRELRPQCQQACSGCPWRGLVYQEQLRAKRSNVVDALVKNAAFDRERAEQLVAPTVPSKREWGYRNKIELGCGADNHGRLALGFYQEGTHNLEPVESCPAAVRPLQKLPRALSGALRYVLGNEICGMFRVGVRGSLRTKDVEVALWTTPGSFPRAVAAKTLASSCKPTSIVRVMAEEGAARKVKKVEALAGKGCWEEQLGDHRFLVSAPSFFQVNTAQAEKLVDLVLEGLEVRPESYVADLYAGGGTFSIPLAAAGADVVAVEAAGSSVRDLRRNADKAGVTVEVVGGDTARELPDLGQLDALVVDPPRAGLAPGVVESIAAACPDRVAYVSCDPFTWARDVALLEKSGYRLVSATPVDLFPQTYHVETVSIFCRAIR